MDLEKELATRKLLDEIAVSVRNIIWRTFSKTTAEEREDIEQDVKLKLWNKISNGKKIANLRSYLWKVVYTTTLDAVKERMGGEERTETIERLDMAMAERVGAVSPELLLEKKERLELVRRHVEGLAPRRRSVVRLHLSGMNLGEIAGHLGLTENQARHLLYRGIGDLAEAVNGKKEIVS